MSETLTRDMPVNTRSTLFISDPHGEYEEFSHIVRGACGAIRRQIDTAFSGSMTAHERAQLATLVMYPREKLALLAADEPDAQALYERLHEKLAVLYLCYADDEADLSDGIAGSLFAEITPDAIVETCEKIQRASIRRIHMLGDVYDRGPAPELIMDELASRDDMDLQWGNHDLVWMGAALGQRGCIAHVVRNCARYANLSVLEDAYGIDLQPLKDLALSAYADDPCAGFALKGTYPELTDAELDLNVKVQKAMAIMQFKVEGRLIDENPSFGLEDRKLLHKMDLAAGTVEVDGVTYELTDTVLPTVDFAHPYELTAQEEAVMAALQESFRASERLQRHARVLLDKGSVYRIVDGMLLFHACVPLNDDGSLKEVELFGKTYRGKALFDAVDALVREAFTVTDPAARKRGEDLLWYLWLGAGSPVFAKSKMATFEIYFIADKAARKEVKNAFYTLYEDDAVMATIFEDFGMDPKTSRIVCGHTPVKVKDGEDPVKCAGKVLVIDGGMSAAYQGTSGIAGFTLVEDEAGLTLYSHEPFCGRKAAIEDDIDLVSAARRLPPLA